jgi:hypothetical protein
MADEEVDWGVDELNETNGVTSTADDVLSLGGEVDEGMSCYILFTSYN